jgi:hypothetical protein
MYMYVTIPAFAYLHLGKPLKSFVTIAMLQAEHDPSVIEINSSVQTLPQHLHCYRITLF